MTQKRIADVIEKHFESLTSIAFTLSGRFAGEDVHAFRVEVKKLRAMLRLAGSCQGLRGRLPDRLHSFYGMAGIIRNLQLQRRSLTDFGNKGKQELPTSCAAVLDSRIVTAISLAQLCLDQKHPFEKTSELLEGLPERIDVAAGRRFVRREMRSFLSLRDERMMPKNRAKLLDRVKPDERVMQGEHAMPDERVKPDEHMSFTRVVDEERLHSFRKSLKDLLYTWPYLSKGARGEIGSMGLSTEKAIKYFADLLGEFRDTCLRLELLQDSDYLFSAGPQSREFLQAAERSWIADKELLLEKINMLLRSRENVIL